MIRIGTSGWQYKHWRGPFYPADLPASRMLAFYLEHFDTVEVNNSFYRLPALETFENWKAASPPGFLFAVKGSRFITHMKKLKDPEPSSRKFFDAVAGLGSKLGPILWQLPPFWQVNAERLDEFLSVLPRRRRYAFEFRNETWFTGEVSAILKRHKAAFCIYDLDYRQSPRTVTADWVYVRLHGPDGKYSGSYPDDALKEWARQFDEWTREGRDVYCYFDNDQAGYAVRNALRLRELVGV
ncbi:MAG: DUF72 domain-containing protein [bacterium]|jgi:uncharacterized protein YecE (DUF72 family)